jgi:hypothetical protein
MRLFEANNPFPLLVEGWEEDEQTRIDTGAAAQIFVVRDFRRKFPSSTVTFQAPRGSQKTDIIMTMKNGEEVHIEVKVAGARITAYDRSIRRGETDAMLDWAASTLPNNKLKLSFTQLMDEVRKQDKRVGFPGDPGVAKSGKVPAFPLKGAAVLGQLRKQLMDRYKDKGDNYLALVVPGSNQVKYYYISGPFLRALHADKFPTLSRAQFDTYGWDPKSGDAVRAAIKVFISP